MYSSEYTTEYKTTHEYLFSVYGRTLNSKQILVATYYGPGLVISG